MALEIVSTTITPAASFDLVDLDAVKDELALTETTHDAFLGRAITQVSRAIATYCNRVLAREKVRDVVYSRLGGEQLAVSRFPILTLTSATLADGSGGQTTLTENTDFIVDKPHGWLIRVGSGGVPVSWYTTPTTVIYEAGLDPVPDDLQQATIRMVAARYVGRGRDPALRSRSQPGLGDETYWVGSIPGMSGPFPDDVLALIEPYRVPVIA